ncbi:MAG TPA: ABC transporter permease [Terriglobales bacterium]|nr:ABC transporter permease [Terriglobales bacterium]
MLKDIILEAYAAMRHNRRRTGLTMLGMAWGIATVVLLLAYGAGFERAIQNIFAGFGVNVMGTFPGRTSLQAGGAKSGTRIYYTLEDVDRLRNNLPQVTHITPQVFKNGKVSTEGRTFDFPVGGFYSSVFNIRSLKMDSGRFFTQEDNAKQARVAVLSSEAKTKLFSGTFAVGETVRIDGVSFEVIGVIQPRQQEGESNINQLVWIPFESMGALRNIYNVDGIWMNYENANHMELENSIRRLMAASHNFRPDDQRAIFVANQQKQVAQFGIISAGLKILLGFIGILTLGIGGVGLMNIMLVSVAQRTREIGVEKALGAERRHILMQFLAEAMAITAAGGTLGILLSYLVSFSVGKLTLYSAIAKYGEAGDIQLIIDGPTLLVAVIVLSFVGMASGMLPALKAANLDPIEALRYE